MLGYQVRSPKIDTNHTDVKFSNSELDTILPLKVRKNAEEFVSGDEFDLEFYPFHSGKSDVNPAQNVLLRAEKRQRKSATSSGVQAHYIGSRQCETIYDRSGFVA